MYEAVSTSITAPACKQVTGSTLTEASTYRAKNPGALSLTLGLDLFAVGCFSALQLQKKENSGTMTSLSRSDKLDVGIPYESQSSVRALTWRRCAFGRFIGSCLFDPLERINLSAQIAEIQSIEPDNTLNGICYANHYPPAIPCSQRNNGGYCLHLIPGQKSENLIFMVRFASIAKPHWHIYMFDNFINTAILSEHFLRSELLEYRLQN
jgi:hypothetical protein